MPDTETTLERRLRLGLELGERLAERAVDEFTGPAPYGFAPLSLEDGQALGLDDEEIAFRAIPTGEVFTMSVEVTCTPVDTEGAGR